MKPEDEPTGGGPATWLTVPGRVLLVVSLLAFGGGFCLYFIGTLPSFPAGRYPILMWAIPVAFVAFLFFAVTALVLEKMGIAIYGRKRRP